jgi:polysaccharide export outer membrane protein
MTGKNVIATEDKYYQLDKRGNLSMTPVLMNNCVPVSKSQANPNLDEQVKNWEYRIGTGDILTVTVWDHPELTTPAGQYRSAVMRVTGSTRMVRFLSLQETACAGKTVSQVREEITARLDKFIEPAGGCQHCLFPFAKSLCDGRSCEIWPATHHQHPLTVMDAVNAAAVFQRMPTGAMWFSPIMARIPAFRCMP